MWLACGLDPMRVTFYRQSDIVEIPELTWLLTCVASKGMMNRSHAYKAAVDANVAAGEDADANINMGLYSYPILMAADILMFNAHRVPVGRDQVQHIEMARDLAQRFNHLFGAGKPLFVLPEANVDERVALLPYRTDELVLVVPAGHALARRRAVRLADALPFDFVGAHPNSAINNQLTRAAAEAGLPLRLPGDRATGNGRSARCSTTATGWPRRCSATASSPARTAPTS